MKKILLSSIALIGIIFVLSSEGEAASPYLVSPDGTYLGNLNTNKYDPNSVANPYGKYGSKYSDKSINNPYNSTGI